MNDNAKRRIEALRRCAALGIPLEPYPLGSEGHHTDLLPTKEDMEIGSALAFFLGGLFVDVDQSLSADRPLRESYFYRNMTSIDVWTRVARALRIHNLKITERT